jgi:hypothetical protein
MVPRIHGSSQGRVARVSSSTAADELPVPSLSSCKPAPGKLHVKRNDSKMKRQHKITFFFISQLLFIILTITLKKYFEKFYLSGNTCIYHRGRQPGCQGKNTGYVGRMESY